MLILLVLWSISDMLLYWCGAACVFSGFGSPAVPAASVICLTVSRVLAFLLRRKKKAEAFSMLPGLVPFGMVFVLHLDHALWQCVFLIPPFVYTGMMIRKKQWTPDGYTCSRCFLQGAAVCLAAIAFSQLIRASISWGILTVLYLVNGMFLIRMLRLKEGGELNRKEILINLSVLIGLTALIGVLSMPAVWKAILSALYLVYRYVLAPAVLYAAMGIAWVFTEIGTFLRWLYLLLFGKGETAAEEAEESSAAAAETVAEWTNAEPGNAVKIVFTVLGMACVLVIAFVLLKKLGRTGKKQEPGKNDLVTEAEKNPPNQPGKGAVRSIRKGYQRLMKELIRRGEEIGDETTSSEIDYLSGAYASGETVHQIRDLYRKARYTDGSGVGEEDKKQFHSLVRSWNEQASGKTFRR